MVRVTVKCTYRYFSHTSKVDKKFKLTFEFLAGVIIPEIFFWINYIKNKLETILDFVEWGGGRGQRSDLEKKVEIFTSEKFGARGSKFHHVTVI